MKQDAITVSSVPPSRSCVFAPAILSAVLLWLAFFPINFWPIAFVALAPWITLVRAEGVGRWRRYSAAWLGGLVFFFLALKWIRVAHPMMAYFAWPGLSIYCSLYFPLALFLIRRLDRVNRLPLVLIFPVVWVGLEYFRAHFPTGFPFLSTIKLQQFAGFGWYFLGYTQHANIPLLQAADLGGVYLLSFVVAAMNVATYEWLKRIPQYRWLFRIRNTFPPRIYTHEVRMSAVAILAAMATLSYGTYRLIHKPFATGPLIAAIQGNLSQDEKKTQRGEQANEEEEPPLVREYFPLAKRATYKSGSRVPDLVIWPETCWPYNWLETYASVLDDPKHPGVRRRVEKNQNETIAVVKDRGLTNMLLGLNTNEWNGQKYLKYNSALLIRPNEEVPYGDRYDKMHLVPFGEYVPFRETLPFMKNFSPYDWDYSCTPGSRYNTMDFAAGKRRYSFGVMICYEDSDPYFARQYNPSSGRALNADFLVNISNDGWFRGSEEHEQHLAICRFRAVESRRTVVRSVNMGISAVIDPDGRIVAMQDLEDWSKSKSVVAVVTYDLPIDNRGSLYAALGDWVPLSCWATIIGVFIYARVRRKTG